MLSAPITKQAMTINLTGPARASFGRPATVDQWADDEDDYAESDAANSGDFPEDFS